MDLRDRSHGDRPLVERLEGESLPEGRLQQHIELRFRHCGLPGVERLQTDAHGIGKHVPARRQDLAELGEKRPGMLDEAVDQARGTAEVRREDVGVQEEAHSGTSRVEGR